MEKHSRNMLIIIIIKSVGEGEWKAQFVLKRGF